MITYKVKKKFQKYAAYLEGHYFPQIHTEFNEDSSRYELFKDAGVLDIWFDKIEPRKRFELTPVSEYPNTPGIYIFLTIDREGYIDSANTNHSSPIDSKCTHFLKEIK